MSWHRIRQVHVGWKKFWSIFEFGIPRSLGNSAWPQCQTLFFYLNNFVSENHVKAREIEHWRQLTLFTSSCSSIFFFSFSDIITLLSFKEFDITEQKIWKTRWCESGQLIRSYNACTAGMRCILIRPISNMNCITLIFLPVNRFQKPRA